MISAYNLPNLTQLIGAILTALFIFVLMGWFAIILSPLLVLVGSVLILGLALRKYLKTPINFLIEPLKRSSSSVTAQMDLNETTLKPLRQLMRLQQTYLQQRRSL
jgi:hypothetical protein